MLHCVTLMDPVPVPLCFAYGVYKILMSPDVSHLLISGIPATPSLPLMLTCGGFSRSLFAVLAHLRHFSGSIFASLEHGSILEMQMIRSWLCLSAFKVFVILALLPCFQWLHGFQLVPALPHSLIWVNPAAASLPHLLTSSSSSICAHLLI